MVYRGSVLKAFAVLILVDFVHVQVESVFKASYRGLKNHFQLLSFQIYSAFLYYIVCMWGGIHINLAYYFDKTRSLHNFIKQFITFV